MSTIDSNIAMGRMQADMATTNADAAKLKASGDKAEMKKVADEFESMFLTLVMKSMRNTVQKSGLMDGGNAEDIYKSMLDDEYSKIMAAQRHTGIADQIEDFLRQTQGIKEDLPPPPNAGAQGLKAYQGAALQGSPKSATIDIGASPNRMKAL